jgi:hypothetical protein
MGVVATALCVALVAAAPASAKVAEYWAPLARPDGENSWIEFKVKSKKNKKDEEVQSHRDQKVHGQFPACELRRRRSGPGRFVQLPGSDPRVYRERPFQRGVSFGSSKPKGPSDC